MPSEPVVPAEILSHKDPDDLANRMEKFACIVRGCGKKFTGTESVFVVRTIRSQQGFVCGKDCCSAQAIKQGLTILNPVLKLDLENMLGYAHERQLEEDRLSRGRRMFALT